MTVVELAPAVQDPYYDAAILWAQEYGWGGSELPQGSDTHVECPLSQATGLLIDEDEAMDVDGNVYPLPPRVSEWVRRFDRGLYPELRAS